MHRSGGGQRFFEIEVNSRHPVMAVVLTIMLRSSRFFTSNRLRILPSFSIGATNERLN
jgi:hypothetical protein